MIENLAEFLNGLVQGVIDAITKLLNDILAALTDAVLVMLEAVIAQLPTADPLALPPSFSGLFIGYGWANSFLPLQEILSMVGVSVTTLLAMGAVQLARVIYEYWPLKGT